jgi:RNA polymerase sigma-70 factor (ECF subfamily)
VAKNKAIDFLRRKKKFEEISPQYAYLLESEYTLIPTVNNFFNENEIHDSQLRMMFACCHPVIPEESQIVLTLKTLCGLSVHEIAKAFLTQEETIAKRIYRAKEKIKVEKIELDAPSNNQLPLRLDAILKSLYLLFNEGYNSSHPDHLIREELCSEAMRLTYILTGHPSTNVSRTNALLSLMCFQASRLQARQDNHGNIILLKYQDHSKWFQPLIQKGFEYLEASNNNMEDTSAYHLEAAIASEYAKAKKFEDIDWQSIFHFYNLLYQINPTAVVALNRAVVVAQLYGAIEGIKAIESILGIEFLSNYYLLHAILGDMYLQLDNKEKAINYFSRALLLTESEAEKKFLAEKMSRIQ